jgi:hypothetical protein
MAPATHGTQHLHGRQWALVYKPGHPSVQQCTRLARGQSSMEGQGRLCRLVDAEGGCLSRQWHAARRVCELGHTCVGSVL